MSAQSFIQMQRPYDNTSSFNPHTISCVHMQMQYESDWADLEPNVYVHMHARAITSNHLQPPCNHQP